MQINKHWLPLKAGIWGFIVGLILIPIAGFGVISGFMEFLRPVLIPGIDLLSIFFYSLESPWLMWIGIILNGVIYAALFILIALVRRSTINANKKEVLTVAIILIFAVILFAVSNLSWLAWIIINLRM